MNLTDVSKTAIATLRSHVIEAARPQPVIVDPMAAVCLDRLAARASAPGEQAIFAHPLSRTLTNHIALRARHYDAMVNAFLRDHPGSTVVNLGCGFDTRYWRIDHEQCTYFELDLPEVAALKRQVLGADLTYELIGASVLDFAWIDRIAATSTHHVLLVAEGLLMYLPRPDVIELLQRLSATFTDSQLIFEAVNKKYTRGFWKKIVERKIQRELGLGAGSAYQFGIQRGAEVETLAPGLSVIDEWSYVKDPDVYPKVLKYLRLERSQWAVTVAINPT